MPSIRKHSLCYCLVSLGILVIALHFSLPHISDKSVQRLPSGIQRAVGMPHFSPDHYEPNTEENKPAEYAYIFEVDYHPLQQSRFKIHPLGCIQRVIINDKVFYDYSLKNGNNKFCTSISLEMVPDQFMNGISVDFGNRLVPGKNTIKIIIYNGGMRQDATFFKAATYGMQFGPVIFSQEYPLTTWIGLLFLCVCVTTLTLAIRSVTQEWVSGVAVSLGFLIAIQHLVTTSFMKYAPDMPSHLEYIAYIANHGSWPNPLAGWQYYHPALYYHIQAWLMMFGNWLGTFDTVMLLQIFSLACFTAFLIFSQMTLRRIIKNPLAYYCALLFVVFHQGGFIYSSRLDSHLLYYAFYAASCYFLVVWLQSGFLKDGQLSLGFFSLALATRSNALSLALCHLAAIWYQWRIKAFHWRDLRTWRMTIVATLLLLAMLVNFGRIFYYNSVEHKNMPYLVGNARGLPPSHIIKNHPNNFLLLDIDAIQATPFWHLRLDNTGRQNFWVSFFKTSLFDFYQWPHPVLAKATLYLLLLNALYATCSLIFLWRYINHKLELRALLLLLVIPIGSLMINRIIHPYSASQNFRYIYPVITSFAGLYGLLLEQYLANKRYVTGAIGALLIAAFALSSSAFIIAL